MLTFYIIGFALLFVAFARLFYSNYALSRDKIKIDGLQQRLSAVELSIKSASEDEIAWKKRVQDEYLKSLEEIKSNFSTKLDKLEKELNTNVNLFSVKFEILLEDEFKKACAAIKFNEIKYKQSITKKRREYNRKNGKFAEPETLWRSIYDDWNGE